jgi:hypothetical protein|eukprot:scaffold1606_cov301-Chaetoceros_neogracile.AAC.2
MEKLSRLHQPPTATKMQQQQAFAPYISLHSIALVFGITPPSIYQTQKKSRISFIIHQKNNSTTYPYPKLLSS